MNYILNILVGALIAIMILVNGTLAIETGLYLSTVMIHAVGLILLLIVMLVKREPFKFGSNLPYWMYLGGAFGVLPVLFNNISFIGIGASLTIALGLLGQSMAAILIDHYGWLKMKKHPFIRKKSVGLAMVVVGIVIMTVF